MYFTRTYKSGGADHDPRQIHWAEFMCSVCGEESEINITYRESTFDFERERKCPHCGQLNPEDHAKSIKAAIEKLTAEKSRIEVRIEQLTQELESPEPKEA